MATPKPRHQQLRFLITTFLIITFLVATAAPAGAEKCGQRAVLVDGTGTYSRPIRTDSPTAQKFFDQGLRLTYGYYFPEAIASFQEALCHAPDHPMIHWGLALAIGPNPNSRYMNFNDDPQDEGLAAIRAAKGAMSGSSEVEQGLIRALDTLLDYDRMPNRDERDRAVIAMTRDLLGKFPEDLEAGFLHGHALMTHAGWRYWRPDGKPEPGSTEAAEALEQVMAIDPGHPGANHLYIHLFEASSEPERALPQAERLEALMPKAGHIVHMPSHIYMRVGAYDKAIASNRRSTEADVYFLKVWGDKPFPAIGTFPTSAQGHARHAHDFIRWAATLQGNYATALESARVAADIPRERWSMGHEQRRIATVWLIHVAFGKWDAVLALPRPEDEYPFLVGMWHFVRGVAQIRSGDTEQAARHAAKLAAIAENPAVAELLVMANPAPQVLDVAIHLLAGEIAGAAGSHEIAVASLEEAVALQDRLAYMEPPDWIPSARLYLGEALLAAGQATRAEAVYRKDLKTLRNNGWALSGLRRSLEAQGRQQEANETRGLLKEAWKGADVPLQASRF